MVRINLLPHRQLKRAQRQREFNIMLAGTVIIGALLVFMVQTFISARVDAQAERNNRLEAASAELDKQIASIKELKKEINAVLERKQVVENLQANRSQAVILLDEIARQLPEGMYLRSIKQEGNVVSLEGVADTNARVATLVRNLSASQYLELPALGEIKSTTVNGIRQNDFVLTVNIKARTAEEETPTPKGEPS